MEVINSKSFSNEVTSCGDLGGKVRENGEEEVCGAIKLTRQSYLLQV